MFYNKFRINSLFLALLATIVLFSACKKDKATENEVITKVVVHLTGVGNAFDTEFEAADADGDGIFNTIDQIELPVGGTFNCHLHPLEVLKFC